MTDGPRAVRPPEGGLWRVARGDDPLRVFAVDRRTGEGGANRFDPLTVDCGVLYFGTDLKACFGEVLARFRPSISLMSVVEREWRDLGFMNVGAIAADWRQRRSAVHIRLPDAPHFLDVESAVTHQFLRRELALGFSALGLNDLDVAAVRGQDRRVTRLIADWTYMAGDRGLPRYAGIRYESRIRSGWECWALFDDEDLKIEVMETLPITQDMEALVETARLFGLQIF